MVTEDLPEEGELVVCTVTNVKNYGAFVSLDEYEGREGFIHIAEVASGWVKYIRDYVREGQKVVCKVLRVDPRKGYVDLSLKQVNEHQKREKIREWKNELKARKLLEVVAERLGKDMDWCWDTFADELVATYGSLYNAFEQCAIDRDSLEEDGFSGEWVPVFVDVAVENIVPPFVHVRGVLEVTSPEPDGVLHVKNALKEAEKVENDRVRVEIKSLGSPKYMIKITAEDYRTAEEELKKAYERAKKAMGTHGTVEFHRKEKK